MKIEKLEIVSNKDLLQQLGDIYRLALRDYPYSEENKLDPAMLLTLGKIAREAKKALEDYWMRNRER